MTYTVSSVIGDQIKAAIESMKSIGEVTISWKNVSLDITSACSTNYNLTSDTGYKYQFLNRMKFTLKSYRRIFHTI